MSCKSPLVWFCNIPIGRFGPIFSLKTTKARVIQNEAWKYIGVKPDLYDPETIFANTHRSCFTPEMDNTEREARYNGWQKAVRQVLTH